MIPASGSHAGHRVERGRCLDCDRYLTRSDYLSVSCALCGAVPGWACTDEDGPRDKVHEERMWAAQGHDPAEFAGMRERHLQRTREARGKRHRPAVLRESTPPAPVIRPLDPMAPAAHSGQQAGCGPRPESR